MQKVFHLNSPREKYHCDAAIIWCFDHRFELVFRKFLKRRGVIHSDRIKVAAANLHHVIPTVEVNGYFVNFEGIYEADLNSTKKPL